MAVGPSGPPLFLSRFTMSDLIDKVEDLINRTLREHADWWDEDQSFDLSYDIVDAVFPDNKFDEDERLDMEMAADDAIEKLTPKSNRTKVREAAEKAVKGCQAIWDKWQSCPSCGKKAPKKKKK
jgi:hypothetical protein